VIVLLMKGKEDALKKEKFKKNVSNEFLDEEIVDAQKKIEKDRREIIIKIIDSPGKKLVEEVVSTTTTPPPPPPPVKEVVEKKSDKKTKSS
ncbi:MAG: hypothetical protein HOE40_04060, partial [Candidatus Pacebacteria bacterium]|nr:hypothetical protein [Candidatus Paceibacterota bacterium]